MSCSIVIPNYNGSKLLQKHLPQVIEASKSVKNVEIIIVDDASTDDSITLLKNQFPQIKVIIHQKNMRFAAACNTGVKKALGDIIVLLNNDVAPKEDFLKPLLSHFSDKLVFAVGCQETDNKIISGRSGGAIRKGLYQHWRSKDQNGPDTLWVAGGSGAFRKSIWTKLGGMDVLYSPAYEEDRDLCYRALKRGYKVLFEPKSKVQHKHETTNISALGKRSMRVASYKNHFIFFWKNITSTPLTINHLLWLPYQLVINGFRTKGEVIQGFIHALNKLPNILSQRRVEKKLASVSDETIIKKFQSI